jgi:hypothetical protein
LKIIAPAVLTAAALLTIGLSPPLSAQTQQQHKTDPAKVYSYKQTSPTPQSTTTPMPMMGQSQTATPQIYMNPDIPYGSPAWWREMDRTHGGDSQ